MPTQETSRIRTGKRPQATNRLGNSKGVYPDGFTLSIGEFLWIVGLLVAARMIAASEEAWSKGNELSL